MLVCICKGISDKDITNAIYEGATGFGDVRRALGVASSCGQCAAFTKDYITTTLAQMQSSQSANLAYELSF